MEIGYLFLAVVTTLNGLYVSATTSENTIRVHRLTNCPNQNLLMYLSDISIKLENDTYLLGFNIVIQENIEEDLNLEYSITRCLNRAAPDTCEKFHNFTFPYFCKMLQIRGPWLAYMQNLEPHVSCPLKKGKYIMKHNVACSLKEVNRLKFARGYFFTFTMKQVGMKSKRVLFCAKAEISS